jgi:hypothetical protein
MLNKVAVIVIFVIARNVCCQNVFIQDIYLPNKTETNYSSGVGVLKKNSSLYLLTHTSNYVNSQVSIHSVFFVKTNLLGDTIFTKQLITDSLIMSNFTFVEIKNSSKIRAIVQSFSLPLNPNPDVSIHLFDIDTFGQVVSEKQYTFNAIYYSNVFSDIMYTNQRNYSKNNTKTESRILKWTTATQPETVFELSLTDTSSLISKLVVLSPNRIAFFTSHIIYDSVQPFIKPLIYSRSEIIFTDSNFNVISSRLLPGYRNIVEIYLKDDTIYTLASGDRGYANSRKFYFEKYNLAGDSVYSCVSQWIGTDSLSGITTSMHLLNIDELNYFYNEPYLWKSNSCNMEVVKKFTPDELKACQVLGSNRIVFTGNRSNRAIIGIMDKNGNYVNIDNKSISADLGDFYPNPSANGFLNIGNFSNGAPINIEIFNTYGKLVFGRTVENESCFETGLTSGIYFIKLEINHKVVQAKWIVGN